jgi:putative ABC transport system ATP-binding protein
MVDLEASVTSSSLADAGNGEAPAAPAIEIRGLQHFYGEGDLAKQVLHDNNLTVSQGEIVIMTGPSGSGKTTLLTLIGTLRKVQHGSMNVLGQEFMGASPEELIEARRKIGFIFQAHNLFESLSAFQNVRMGMELFDFSAAEMKERCEDLLTRLDLGHRIHYKPKSLSGGQKQRVAVARGLAHRPKLILADEPTAALDKETGRTVVSLFQEMTRNEGCTVIMVTHDNRILDVADRIVHMVDGRIASDVVVKESTIICGYLAKGKVFEGLTPGTLTDIADRMRAERFKQGDVIIKEGDIGDKFYLIRQGSVDVFRQNPANGENQHIVTLSDGEYFGEMALMPVAPNEDGSPVDPLKRNATVVAKEDMVVYSLGKDHFQAVVRHISSFENQVRQTLFGGR